MDKRNTPWTLRFLSWMPAALLFSTLFPAGALALDPERVSALSSKAEERGSVRVIVGLDVAFTPEGNLRGAQAVADQRQRIRRAQDEVLAALAGLEAELIVRYDFIPFMAVTTDAAALTALAAFPEITSIEEDIAVPPAMASSNPVIGAPNAWASGFTGTGWAVAILDTGVDSTHPFFSTSGKVVSEACYSTTSAPDFSTSVCPAGSNTAPGSGAPCAIAGCDHGTHVAGTAAGDDTIGPDFGVARGADVIAIQVFSRFDDVLECYPDPSPCIQSFTSDQILGLERVAELAASFDMAAANMSLGGGQVFDQATCDANNVAIKAAIDSLRALGIATVIAAGNSGFRDSLGAPGCVSTAVSVGATDDFDDVASFSNIAPFVSLLAPGVSIDSSVPGNAIGNKDGTSMAAPHVTGAWALIKQKNPDLSVSDALAVLQATGTLVDDQRLFGIEIDMPRINVDLALADLACVPDSFELDDLGIFAGVISSGIPQTHNICPIGDEDWVTFTLNEKSDVVLETSGPAGDTRMWLRDAAQDIIESNDDGGNDLFSRIDRACDLDPLPAGTYFAQIDEFGDDGEIASYDLSLTASACPCVDDFYEPDNDALDAFFLDSGSPQTHSLCPVGDEDWLIFSLSETSQVVLETAGPSGDTRLWLRDAAETEIEFNDDGGPDLFSRIDRVCGVDALPAGIYFVQIDEFGDDEEMQEYSIEGTFIDCASVVFTDGFESGDVLEWSGSTP